MKKSIVLAVVMIAMSLVLIAAECFTCKGQGVLECSICKGTGAGHYCNSCNGNGYIKSGSGAYAQKNKCYTCRGTGSMKCMPCAGCGFTKCSVCKGTGQTKY